MVGKVMRRLLAREPDASLGLLIPENCDTHGPALPLIRDLGTMAEGLFKSTGMGIYGQIARSCEDALQHDGLRKRQ